MRLSDREFKANVRALVATQLEEELTDPETVIKNPSEYLLGLPDRIRSGERVVKDSGGVLQRAIVSAKNLLQDTGSDSDRVDVSAICVETAVVAPKLPPITLAYSRLSNQNVCSSVLRYISYRFDERVACESSAFYAHDNKCYIGIFDRLLKGENLSYLMRRRDFEDALVYFAQHLRLTHDEIDELRRIIAQG